MTAMFEAFAMPHAFLITRSCLRPKSGTFYAIPPFDVVYSSQKTRQNGVDSK